MKQQQLKYYLHLIFNNNIQIDLIRWLVKIIEILLKFRMCPFWIDWGGIMREKGLCKMIIMFSKYRCCFSLLKIGDWGVFQLGIFYNELIKFLWINLMVDLTIRLLMLKSKYKMLIVIFQLDIYKQQEMR